MAGPVVRCDDKRTWKQERDARRALRKMRRRVVDPFRLDLYWCARHNGWHIGNRPIRFRQHRGPKRRDRRSDAHVR